MHRDLLEVKADEFEKLIKEAETDKEVLKYLNATLIIGVKNNE